MVFWAILWMTAAHTKRPPLLHYLAQEGGALTMMKLWRWPETRRIRLMRHTSSCLGLQLARAVDTCSLQPKQRLPNGTEVS